VLALDVGQPLLQAVSVKVVNVVVDRTSLDENVINVEEDFMTFQIVNVGEHDKI
jgi:hypothetical protein